MKCCQSAVHEWGASNQVVFDPTKEQLVIIHRTQKHGEVFKLLGTWIDTKLVMSTAVTKIVSKASPKLMALLCTNTFYSVGQMSAAKKHIFGAFSSPALGHFTMRVTPCSLLWTEYKKDFFETWI